MLVMGAGMIGALIGLVKVAVYGPRTTIEPIVYLATLLLLGLGLRRLLRLKMKVAVSQKRIKYRLFPIHTDWKSIPWDEVETCEVVRSPRFSQWHGSNIHFGGELWYSLTGRNGLSIKTRDGKWYFIGCKDVEALESAVNQVMVG